MMEDDEEEVSNPFLTLLQLTHKADLICISQAASNPDLQNLLHRKDQEIAIARTSLYDLTQKIEIDAQGSQHAISLLQAQLDAKDKELNKTKKENVSLREENQRLADELSKSHKALADLMGENQAGNKRFAQELADVRLKHEQELCEMRDESRLVSCSATKSLIIKVSAVLHIED